MTLLTLAQAVADEVGLDRPAAIVGSSQPDPQKLLRYATRVTHALMKRIAWQALRRERTFTSVAGEAQSGLLTEDFDRFVPETFWNRSDAQLITGPVPASQWQGLKASGAAGTPKFAHRGNDVLLLPAPGAGKALAFEYVSNRWCASAGGTAQAAWAADSDVALIDEELIVRGMKLVYLTDSGLPNGVAAQDFAGYLDTLTGNDQPAAGVMVAGDVFGIGRHYDGVPGGGAAPHGGIGVL